MTRDDLVDLSAVVRVRGNRSELGVRVFGLVWARCRWDSREELVRDSRLVRLILVGLLLIGLVGLLGKLVLEDLRGPVRIVGLLVVSQMLDDGHERIVALRLAGLVDLVELATVEFSQICFHHPETIHCPLVV